MSDRWAAADLLAAPIADVRRNRAIIGQPRGPGDDGGKLAASKQQASSKLEAGAPPGGWLHRLMQCPSWGGRRLDPEEELSLWVAAELRRLTRSGALRAVWTRCPVEVRRGGGLAAMWQCLGRVLGVVPGCPDFLVLWGTGAGGLELKVERAQGDMLSPCRRRTYLRQGQKDFREWCLMLGVKHAVCRSVPEVLTTLREWGRL